MTTLENPVTKERILMLPSEPGVLRFEEHVPPDMVRPPVHLHRSSAERFEVLEGQLTLHADGEDVRLDVGQSMVLPPGTPHTWWNSGTGLLRILTEFNPAGNIVSFFETFCGVAQEGRANKQGGPPFLQVVASAQLWDTYLAKPPVAVQRGLFTLLRPLAKARGYRPSYERFRAAQS